MARIPGIRLEGGFSSGPFIDADERASGTTNPQLLKWLQPCMPISEISVGLNGRA
jgi:hypothetical protein